MRINIGNNNVLNIDVDSFVGCCGLSIMSDPSFHYVQHKKTEKLIPYFEGIKKELEERYGTNKEGYHYDERVGSVLFTDIKGGFFYKFAEWLGLKPIHKTKNPKTKNVIYIWAYRVNKDYEEEK